MNLSRRSYGDRLWIELVELIGRCRAPGVTNRPLDAAKLDRLASVLAGRFELGHDALTPWLRDPVGIDRARDPRQQHLPARRRAREPQADLRSAHRRARMHRVGPARGKRTCVARAILGAMSDAHPTVVVPSTRSRVSMTTRSSSESAIAPTTTPSWPRCGAWAPGGLSTSAAARASWPTGSSASCIRRSSTAAIRRQGCSPRRASVRAPSAGSRAPPSNCHSATGRSMRS